MITLSNLFDIPAQFNKRSITHWCAVGLGSGLAKKAPGTWGTLTALPLVYFSSSFSTNVYFIISLLLILVGIFVCTKVNNDFGEHDHKAIVIDEIAGFFLAMNLITMSLQMLIIAFILFRFFDIVKPGPINWIDKNINGGLGIMLDDVFAGIMTWLVLWISINII